MKRFEIRRYRPEHMKNMNNGVDPELFEAWARINYDESIAAYTFFDGARPIYCCGIREYWTGSGEAWAAMVKDAYRYGLAHVVARRLLDAEITKHSLERVQAYARADDPRFVRYLEYMGFEKEALCRKFGPDGIDSYLYARVR